MRLFASGCSIIASSDGGERAGLTASAVCAVTADPARLLVCIDRGARVHTIIVESGTLSLNVLSASQEHVAQRFAAPVEGLRGQDRFLEGEWRTGCLGAPVLEGAIASFECRVVEVVPAGTHTVFICEVVDVVADAAMDPLIVFDQAYRALKVRGETD